MCYADSAMPSLLTFFLPPPSPQVPASQQQVACSKKHACTCSLSPNDKEQDAYIISCFSYHPPSHQAPPCQQQVTCSKKRAQVRSYPVKAVSGMLWMWPDSGEARWIEAEVQPVAQQLPPEVGEDCFTPMDSPGT